MDAQQQEEETRPVAEIAGELGDAARELYDRLDIRREIDEHPYRTVAIAAGVGYVLGGGLFSPMTRRLLRLGIRLALVPVVKSVLESAGGDPDLFD